MLFLSHELRPLAVRLEPQREPARLPVDDGRTGAVVEHGESALIGAEAHVMLEGERGTWAEPEARSFAAQDPDHPTALMVDLVRRPCVAGGHDQVAVVIQL